MPVKQKLLSAVTYSMQKNSTEMAFQDCANARKSYKTVKPYTSVPQSGNQFFRVQTEHCSRYLSIA